ncbi:MAG TPA: FMN-dependent NADH-azoreductase [Chthoniobacterales bacterium]|nr:FMN-dependent NADH-azoreductase [Chthoniobacterales bacterium]
MANLLHIDSSPLGEASVSRALSGEFVQNWKAANPGGKIVTLDISAQSLPSVTAPWLAANFTPEEARTKEQKELLSVSETLVAELLAADVLVLGVPMHNFSIPAALKLWIDQIVRAGKTFNFTENGYVGLVTGKEVHVFVASGGVYDPGSPAAGLNFVEPYLRAILGFIGITDIRFLWAGGTAGIMRGQIDRNTLLAPHLTAIRAQFR